MNKLKFKFIFLILVNTILIFVSLNVGAVHLSLHQMFAALAHPNGGESWSYIFTNIRLPRTMALFSIGLSLGFCGVILQTFLDNPLAEPYTLGLSGGATLGAVIALLINFNPLWLTLPLGASLGCFLTTALVIYFLNRSSQWKTNSIILIGVMISLFCGSFVTLIISVLKPTQMQMAIYWMMGQVGSPRDQWWIFLFAIFLFFILFAYKKNIHLDRILLGEESAQNLGTPVKDLRKIFIVMVCILTAISVSIAGLVGFVGLVSPHITYQFFGSRRHKKTLLGASLIGAQLFLCADILARLFSPEMELPSGSLMAMIGAPILIYYLVGSLKNARL